MLFKGPFRVDFMYVFPLQSCTLIHWPMDFMDAHRTARNWSLVAHATFLNELLLHVQKKLMGLELS